MTLLSTKSLLSFCEYTKSFALPFCQYKFVLRRDGTTLCCVCEIKQASVLQVMELKGETKLEGVRMAMGAFDCPICYEPLMPPIYQVGR
jgi:hypothetical protein